MNYGSDFLEALKPVIDSAPKNGAFITSCVCHGCPWSTVTTGATGDTKTSYGHYAAWHNAHRLAAAGDATAWKGVASTTIHIDSRAPNGGGKITNKECMAFP